MNWIFDFGAVVFEWRPVELVQTHFPRVARDEAGARALAEAIFGHADWRAFDAGRCTADQVIESTVARLNLEREPFESLVTRLPDVLRPIAGTVQVLEQLRSARQDGIDLKLFFLSNMPAPVARELQRRHAFIQWFDGGIFSGDVMCAKPD